MILARRSCGVCLAVLLLLVDTRVSAGEEEPELLLNVNFNVERIVFGEPFSVSIQLTNHTDRNVFVPADWAKSYLTVSIAYEGEVVAERPLQRVGTQLAERHVVLEPGSTVVREMCGFQMFNSELDVDTLPGEYRLQATFSSPGSLRGRNIAIWRGQVESSPAKLTIQPLDDADELNVLRLVSIDPAQLARGRFAGVWSSASDGRSRMQAVVNEYPQSIFAKHAHFRLGRDAAEWFITRNVRFDEARKHFDTLITTWPESQSAYRARLMLARVLLERADRFARWEEVEPHREAAIAHLRTLVTERPNASEAATAQELLHQIASQREADNQDEE